MPDIFGVPDTPNPVGVPTFFDQPRGDIAQTDFITISSSDALASTSLALTAPTQVRLSPQISVPVDIGTGATNANSDTVSVTTTGIVNAGEHVIVIASANNGTGAPTCSGGGLTWQLDADQAIANKVVIFSAYAPAGLASGTVITITFTAVGTGIRLVGVMSVAGLAPSNWFDQASTFTSGTTAQAAWDTGTTGTRTSAQEISIGGAKTGVATTSTVTFPAVELQDTTGALQNTLTTVYHRENLVGTSDIQGAWADPTASVRGAIATYQAAPVAAVAAPTLALTAKTQIPLDASAAVATTSLAFTPIYVPLETASAVATTTLALTAPTQVLLSPTIGTPVDLGTGANGANAATVSVTTTGAVSAGQHVIVVASCQNNGTGAPTCSGGGLTWQLDADQALGNKVVIFSAYAPSGLASSTAITVTFATAASANKLVGAMSVSGLAAANWFDASTTFSSGGVAQAAWDTGTTATRTSAQEISIGGAKSSVAVTSTTTAPATELQDTTGALTNGLTTAYQQSNLVGTSRIQGTFSLATGTVRGAIGTYKAAPVAAITAPTLTLTAPTAVPLNSSVATAVPTLALTAQTQIPLDSVAAVATPSLFVTAQTQIPLDTSSAVTTTSLAFTPIYVPLAASNGVATTTLALTATTQVPLDSASAVATPTLALTAQTQVALDTSSAVATTALNLAQYVPLGTSAAIATDSLALSAQTTVPLGTSAAVASTSTFALNATIGSIAGLASTTDGVTYTTGSATPTARNLIVVTATLTGETSTNWTVTDSQGGTYTKIRRQVQNSSADIMEVWVADQFASAVATTWTYSHASGNATGCTLQVDSVSGMSRTSASAIRSQGGEDNQAAGGTPAPTLGLTALTGNPVLTLVHNASNPPGLTAPSGSGFVVVINRNYNTPTTGFGRSHTNKSFTGTTVTWGSTSATAFSSVAVELAFDPSIIIALASSAVATPTIVLNAPTPVPLATSSAVATTSLALTAQTTVPLATSAGTSSTSLALTAPTTISLDTSSSVSSTSLALTAKTQISLDTSAALATTSLTLAQYILLAASVATASSTLDLTATTQVSLGTSSTTSTPTLALTAPTQVSLATSSAQSSTTFALAQYVELGASAGTTTSALALTAKAQIQLSDSAALGDTALDLTDGTGSHIHPSHSVGLATTGLELTAPTQISLIASSGIASTALNLSATTTISLGVVGGAASTAVVAISVPARVSLTAAAGHANATLLIGGIPKISGTVSAESRTYLTLNAPKVQDLGQYAIPGSLAVPGPRVVSLGDGGSLVLPSTQQVLTTIVQRVLVYPEQRQEMLIKDDASIVVSATSPEDAALYTIAKATALSISSDSARLQSIT